MARKLNIIQVSKMFVFVRRIQRTEEKVVRAEKGVLCSFRQELRQYLSGQEMLTVHVIRRERTWCVFWMHSISGELVVEL